MQFANYITVTRPNYSILGREYSNLQNWTGWPVVSNTEYEYGYAGSNKYYVKLFQFTVNSRASHIIGSATGITPAKIIYYDYILRASDGTVNKDYYLDTTDFCRVWLTSGNWYIKLGSSYPSLNCTVYIVVYYTK